MKPSRIWAHIWALLALWLCACPSSMRAGLQQPSSVLGKVQLAQADGSFAPLPAAKVLLTGQYTNLTQTDEVGAFGFEGVPPGRYVVKASYSDFTREGEITAQVDVEAGKTVEVPTLSLTPAGAIAGAATLGGAQTRNGGIRVTLDGTDAATTTADDGTFFLAKVPVGSYRIRVEKGDYGGRTRRGIEVRFGEVTQVDALDIEPGISADFNHPPTFAQSEIALMPYQAQGDITPLPLDLAASEVARYDTVALHAAVSDDDNDRLEYFWSVTAGTLDRTDGDRVMWRVNDKRATAATITVRVVDERSGAAYLSRQVSIVDTQMLSAQLSDARALYAYRPFSQPWRVLEYDFATKAVARLAQINSLVDPEPQRVGAYLYAAPYVDGQTQAVFWQPGETPQPRALAVLGSGRVFNGRVVQALGSILVAYDPATDLSATLLDCVSSCGEIVDVRDDRLLLITRNIVSGENTLRMYVDGSTALNVPISLSRPVGRMPQIAKNVVVFTDVPPDAERGSVNALLSLQWPSSFLNQEMLGLYDVFIGDFDGRYVGFTEQPYRVVFSPERAFVYDTQKQVRRPIDGGDAYAYDKVLTLRGGRLAARRYPSEDWLQSDERTHYQVVVQPQPAEGR